MQMRSSTPGWGLAAALLTAIAAGVTTKRLLYTPPSRDPARSWGAAYRGDDAKSSPPYTGRWRF